MEIPSIQPFADALITEGKRRGIEFRSRFSPDCYYDIQARRIGILQCFQDAVVEHKLNKGKTLFVCVIKEKGSREYGQVKRAAEQEGAAGVLTQCVVQKNLTDQRSGGVNLSVVKNLLLKINAKMGGTNHVPLYPAALKEVSILRIPTLIIGIDVTHGVGGGFSFAAVTGSLDRTGMPYMMDIQAQKEAEKGAAEVVGNLDVILEKFLRAFREKEGVPPRRIIVFRDGVGSGQFPEVLQAEMLKLRKACSKLSEKYKPPITFIAVQKRHKVRFFIDRDGGIASDNVPPGTVVDEQIVGYSDFYLVSHKGALVRNPQKLNQLKHK